MKNKKWRLRPSETGRFFHIEDEDCNHVATGILDLSLAELIVREHNNSLTNPYILSEFTLQLADDLVKKLQRLEELEKAEYQRKFDEAVR